MFYDDDELHPNESYSLEDALGALPFVSENGTLAKEIVFGFSDLLPDDLTRIKPAWQGLTDSLRLMIMERLADSTEADFALDFSIFAHLGYDDPHEAVRLASIRAGWADESLNTLQKLMYLVQTDPSQAVRAAAMVHIGHYLYLGEVEDLEKADTAAAEELAFSILTDNAEDLSLRCRALEALANTTRAGISQLIEDAYHSGNTQLRQSAVAAMGNTCKPQWEKYVLLELDSDEPEMILEAISATGNIGLEKAIPKLLQFAYGKDEEAQEAAIWALGEIGGAEAIDALQELAEYAEQENDDDLLEIIEDSLGAAEMVSQFFTEDDFDEDEYAD